MLRATGRDLVRHADTSRLMAELEAVAAKLNIELPISIEQRMAGTEKVGAHKASMLQDFEAGRWSSKRLVGVVIKLGDRLGVPITARRVTPFRFAF